MAVWPELRSTRLLARPRSRPQPGAGLFPACYQPDRPKASTLFVDGRSSHRADRHPAAEHARPAGRQRRACIVDGWRDHKRRHLPGGCAEYVPGGPAVSNGPAGPGFLGGGRWRHDRCGGARKPSIPVSAIRPTHPRSQRQVGGSRFLHLPGRTQLQARRRRPVRVSAAGAHHRRLAEAPSLGVRRDTERASRSRDWRQPGRATDGDRSPPALRCDSWLRSLDAAQEDESEDYPPPSVSGCSTCSTAARTPVA